MVKKLNSMFDSSPKSKRLAKIISIKSPEAFEESIRKIKKGGVTLHEKRGLILAQNRAKAQLSRKNLSVEERMEMDIIAKMKLPEVDV